MTQTEARQRVNFVAPLPTVEVPTTVDVQPIQATDTSGAWVSVPSPSRDSVSAVDRAKAFNIRQVPVYASALLLSASGTILYTITLLAADVTVAPYALDKVLAFLLLTGVGVLVSHTKANKVDYEHSHAGIERHRLTLAADIRRAELAAELELRHAALDAQLRLLERRQDDAQAPHRAIGVQHDR